MILPYWEELRGDEVRLFPVVPVTLSEHDRFIESFALVDSGAEHNIFPLEAAEDLELDLSHERDVTIIGAGGKETPGKISVVDYKLGRLNWTAPIIFSQAVVERPLLGQLGFFAFFTVTFRYSRRDIQITRKLNSP
jgi:hypothetical protein